MAAGIESGARSWAPSAGDLSFDLFQLDRAPDRDLVDDPERLRLLSRHEMIAIQRSFNGFVRLASVVDINLVEAPLDLQNILCVSLNVGRLALEPARRLVNHDAGIGQGEWRPFLARGEQKRAHRRRLSNAHRRHLGTN